MATKRPSAADAISDIAPPLPVSAQPKENTLRYQRYGKPATYRLPPELIDQLKNIADQEHVKISDLATFALKHFVSSYNAKTINLPKSEPSRYDLKID